MPEVGRAMDSRSGAFGVVPRSSEYVPGRVIGSTMTYCQPVQFHLKLSRCDLTSHCTPGGLNHQPPWERACSNMLVISGSVVTSGGHPERCCHRHSSAGRSKVTGDWTTRRGPGLTRSAWGTTTRGTWQQLAVNRLPPAAQAANSRRRHSAARSPRPAPAASPGSGATGRRCRRRSCDCPRRPDL